MHCIIKHITNKIGISLFLIFSMLIAPYANSEQSVEDIIKARKSLFSKNYKTAKRVQSLSASSEFDKSKKLMIEMSKNYELLLELFPDNTKDGFKTGSLPIIWKDKDNFNALMLKSSNDMIMLASIIENEVDTGAIIKKLMWSNCKACHTKYRKPH